MSLALHVLRLALILVPLAAAPARAACPPAPPAKLRAALDGGVPSTRLQELALGLVDCLAEPDPALRDELGFELLAAWLRAGVIAPTTLQHLRERLLPMLGAPGDANANANGFAAPFAALALAELARVDRLQPWLSQSQRAEMLTRACAWLSGVRDRRGYVAGEGWRHSVAHGADWLMQLSLNPAMEPEQQRQILEAVASQVLADGRHAYQFGEGQRLARTALFAAVAADLSAETWGDWLTRLLVPLGPAAAPLDAVRLVRLHNAREFLWPLYVSLNELRDEAARARLLPAVAAALKRLPS